MEKIVWFRIAGTQTPKKGFDLLKFWGDYDGLSDAVLDALDIDHLDNPLNVSMNELDISIEITDDNADFDHDTLKKFMESSTHIDKELAEVFLHWCIETDSNVSEWETFEECYEGEYSSVEEFAEDEVDKMISCSILDLPDFIIGSLDYTKVWEKFENEHITYLDKNVHIIRKSA